MAIGDVGGPGSFTPSPTDVTPGGGCCCDPCAGWLVPFDRGAPLYMTVEVVGGSCACFPSPRTYEMNADGLTPSQYVIGPTFGTGVGDDPPYGDCWSPPCEPTPVPEAVTRGTVFCDGSKGLVASFGWGTQPFTCDPPTGDGCGAFEGEGGVYAEYNVGGAFAVPSTLVSYSVDPVLLVFEGDVADYLAVYFPGEPCLNAMCPDARIRVTISE